MVLGSLALGALAVAAANADGLATLWGGYTDPASWAALGWAGLGPGALASYLHVTVRAAFAIPGCCAIAALRGRAACATLSACAEQQVVGSIAEAAAGAVVQLFLSRHGRAAEPSRLPAYHTAAVQA